MGNFNDMDFYGLQVPVSPGPMPRISIHKLDEAADWIGILTRIAAAFRDLPE